MYSPFDSIPTSPGLMLFCAIAYILGSIPFGRMIARKFAGVDIAERGSRNIGATNVARELGLKWGLFTLALDMAKGFLPTLLFGRLFPTANQEPILVGLAALFGHQFSAFNRLKGGKGVATALGAYLATAPWPSLGALALFLLTVYLSDFVSLGSMLSAALMPLLLGIAGRPKGVIFVSLIIAFLICYKHKDNIGRIRRGEERKWRDRTLRRDVQEVDPIPRRNRNV